MAERASMTALIDVVERLVNDQLNEAHSRDDIQAALDVYRLEARYMPLVGVPTRTSGGVTWLSFDGAVPYWETDASFYDATYTAIVPTISHWATGRWTFATEPAAPVVILGWNHDPYLAAADLLEIRAAQVAEGYDFTTGPDSYKRSQRHGQLIKQAALYRAMSPRRKVEAEAAAVAALTMPEMTIDVFRF
jgi:hypothetical protein